MNRKGALQRKSWLRFNFYFRLLTFSLPYILQLTIHFIYTWTHIKFTRHWKSTLRINSHCRVIFSVRTHRQLIYMRNWNRGNVQKATRKSKSWARSNRPILLTRVKFMAYVRKNYSTLKPTLRPFLFQYQSSLFFNSLPSPDIQRSVSIVYQLLRTNWRNTFLFVPFPSSPPPFFLFLDIFGLLYPNFFLSFFVFSFLNMFFLLINVTLASLFSCNIS